MAKTIRANAANPVKMSVLRSEWLRHMAHRSRMATNKARMERAWSKLARTLSLKATV